MKSLKKFISSVAMAASLLFATSFSANALVITHDIFDDFGLIGSFSVEIKQNALNTGILDTAFGDDIQLIDFSLNPLVPWEVAPFFFGAVIDTDNIYAGVEFFEIDADDVGFPPEITWSYQLFYDAFDGPDGFGFIDVFDADGGFISFYSGVISIGPAQVSAPASALLFMFALVAIFAGRKRLI